MSAPSTAPTSTDEPGGPPRPTARELLVALEVLVSACPVKPTNLTTRELAIAAVAAATARAELTETEASAYDLAIVREAAELTIRDDTRTLLRFG